MTLPIESVLDLRRTLRPLHGRFGPDGWWLPARTPDGAGTLRLRRTGQDLIGDAWGEGAGWLLDRVSAIAGLHDDPGSFETDHPVVSPLHRSHPGWRFGRTDLVFDSLVPTICAQKVTGMEAKRAMQGLYRRFSDPAPGPNPSLRLPPDPVRIADAPYYRFHELHLEKRRADLLRRVSGEADCIDRLAQISPRSAANHLERIPGISAWTSATTLAVSHGDPDQVPVGDFHIKHIVVHHLTGRDRGTDEEMLELLEPFRPHRGRVVRLLHTLGHEPKFGPRMAARNITRM
ncbi:MAG TPA: DNA-3-methyladenine glycosylase 2 family protein [Acidimicrobiia bacterium]|nr:DNA-3-methyladenine glycosylase 2 family protein [Acidimicrobiia bacterium]